MAGAVLFCWIKRVVETDIIFWYNTMRYAFDKKHTEIGGSHAL